MGIKIDEVRYRQVQCDGVFGYGEKKNNPSLVYPVTESEIINIGRRGLGIIVNVFWE